MRFFITEEFLGAPRFRLELFYPWPTALGIAGMLPLLLATRDPSRRWRAAGLLGGLTALVLSYSRAVFVGFALILAVSVFLRVPARTRVALIAVAGVAANAAFLHGFLQSPWLGHGWFGDTYARWMPLQIGSHSSFYGVLYRGGLVTFSAVCIAYLATCALCAARWATGAKGAARALALMLVYGMVAYGENIETLVLALLVSFVWIGGELAPIPVPRGAPAPNPFVRRLA